MFKDIRRVWRYQR